MLYLSKSQKDRIIIDTKHKFHLTLLTTFTAVMGSVGLVPADLAAGPASGCC